MTELPFQTFHFDTDDGLRLYGRDYLSTPIEPLPIVCLAGLSRNSRDFQALALRLVGDGHRVITMDYRGRGQSDRDSNPANYTIVREAKDVVAMLDHLGISRASFIGTSRGGLILHILAATAPDRIAGVVLNDIGPVIEMDGLRRIRDYLTTGTTFTSRSAVADALKLTHGAEFPALEAQDWLDMADALYRQSEGVWVADFDMALAEPLKTMDFSAALPDLWLQYECFVHAPVLIVRGEHSRLLSRSTVAEMLRRHPKARTISSSGQGHAPLLHLDNVYQPLAAFLKTLR